MTHIGFRLNPEKHEEHQEILEWLSRFEGRQKSDEARRLILLGIHLAKGRLFETPANQSLEEDSEADNADSSAIIGDESPSEQEESDSDIPTEPTEPTAESPEPEKEKTDEEKELEETFLQNF